MKKTMIVAAVAGLFAVAAQAQSSVTLYGLVDAGMTFATEIEHGPDGTSTGNHFWGLRSGNASGSRFGLRGVEDLGNGMKATFVLENGFSVTHGALDSDLIFGRQAHVGISSEEWGQISLGRQYDTNYDFLAPFTLSGTGYGGSISGAPFDNNNLLSSVRSDNAVKFTSSDISGMKFGAMYNFSNGLNFGKNRSFGGAASYNVDGLNVAAGYYHRVSEAFPIKDGIQPDLNENFISYGRARVYGAGADYSFGPVQVSGLFTRSNYDREVAVYSRNVPGIMMNTYQYNFDYMNFTNIQANARYSLTPAWNLSGQYIYTQVRMGHYRSENQNDTRPDVAPKYHTVTLQTAYALSKRTDVYLMGTLQHSPTSYREGDTNGQGEQCKPPKKHASALTAGVRHRF